MASVSCVAGEEEIDVSNVKEINPVKNGDLAFMMCPCTDPATLLMVVAIVQDQPIISSLVCPECEEGFDVVNGIVYKR